MSDKAKKPLLTFAHYQEGRAFLEDPRTQKLKFVFDGVFEHPDYFVAVIGEGSVSASEKTVSVCAQWREQISHVVNLGVAGALTDNASKGQIFSVRTVYGEKVSGDMEYKSFTSLDSHATFDCVSAERRIQSPDAGARLRCFAPFVDRELWSVASAAKLFCLGFYAFKIVSDDVSQAVDCGEVRDNADFYSNCLKTFFDRFFAEVASQPSEAQALPEGFYFTVSQTQKYLKLLKTFSVRNQGHQLDKWASELRPSSGSAKEKTSQLLTRMQNFLSPIDTHLHNRIQACTLPLRKINCRVKFSEGYENDVLELRYKITSEEDVAKLQNALKNFSYGQVRSLLSGDLDV